MRRSIDELRDFYGERIGVHVREVLARRLEDVWGPANGMDVLGLGYAAPWLEVFTGARRTIAAMPGGQGAETWPVGARNRSALVDENRLPFASGAFDRVLLVHALEEADAPALFLAEAVRTLAPAGRIILACAARGGLWSRMESTPFGHGRPFTRRQLERLVRDAGLEPTAWSQALYTPPWTPALPFAEGLEQIGRRIMPGAAGLILLEAGRRAYVRADGGRAVPARAAVPAYAPQPAARTTVAGEALAGQAPETVWRSPANGPRA